jgi:hypothetical protein
MSVPRIQRASLPLRGLIRSITGTDPAANVEISETVPAGMRWVLLAFAATLVTDATVASRTPWLLIDDGVTELANFAAIGITAASGSSRYSWSNKGFQDAGMSNGRFGSSIATLILTAGFRIRTLTASFQAGDNWGAPQYLVEQFNL